MEKKQLIPRKPEAIFWKISHKPIYIPNFNAGMNQKLQQYPKNRK